MSLLVAPNANWPVP